MFERKREKLLSPAQFRLRLLRTILIGIALVLVSLGLGILGYHYLGHLGWTDSFLNASMILGGMGPVDVLTDKTAKIFAGCYALFSGISFLSAFAVIIAPIFHRFLHKFHLETEGDN